MIEMSGESYAQQEIPAHNKIHMLCNSSFFSLQQIDGKQYMTA